MKQTRNSEHPNSERGTRNAKIPRSAFSGARSKRFLIVGLVLLLTALCVAGLFIWYGLDGGWPMIIFIVLVYMAGMARADYLMRKISTNENKP